MTEYKTWALRWQSKLNRGFLIVSALWICLYTAVGFSKGYFHTKESFWLELLPVAGAVILNLFLVVYRVKTSVHGFELVYGVIKKKIGWVDIKNYESRLGFSTSDGKMINFNSVILKNSKEFDQYVKQRIKASKK